MVAEEAVSIQQSAFSRTEFLITMNVLLPMPSAIESPGLRDMLYIPCHPERSATEMLSMT
jgi:hypothetical protein